MFRFHKETYEAAQTVCALKQTTRRLARFLNVSTSDISVLKKVSFLISIFQGICRAIAINR